MDIQKECTNSKCEQTAIVDKQQERRNSKDGQWTYRKSGQTASVNKQQD